jgi:hypothetical protein
VSPIQQLGESKKPKNNNNQYIINNNTIWMTNKDQPNKPIISPDSKAPLEEENDLGVFQTMANRLKLI